MVNFLKQPPCGFIRIGESVAVEFKRDCNAGGGSHVGDTAGVFGNLGAVSIAGVCRTLRSGPDSDQRRSELAGGFEHRAEDEFLLFAFTCAVV